MADLDETATWPEGVRQLEVTDLVLAGEEGPDNIAPGQLAKRTRVIVNWALAFVLDFFREQTLDSGPGTLFGFAKSTSTYVVVGAAGVIQTAPRPGDDWAAQAPDAAYAGDFFDVCWSPELALFVAVGETGEIQTSPDGIAWTHRAPDAAYADSFTAVCWSAALALFVAVGETGEIQTSPNGTAWTRRAPDAAYAGDIFGVAWCPTLALFVVVGETGEVQTSPNGTAWTHRAADAAYADSFSAVCALTDGGFVAVGNLGEMQGSPDGIAWTHLVPDASYALQWWDVACARGAVVAVGTAGELQYSLDSGVTWTRTYKLPGTTTAVHFGERCLVGGNAGGSGFVSASGPIPAALWG